MITRSDPFREALSLRRAMDQLFEQSFVQPSSPSLIALMDVCETPNGYEVDVALPGARPEDIELTVDANALTIRGRFSYQNEHQDQSQGGQQDGGKQAQQPQREVAEQDLYEYILDWKKVWRTPEKQQAVASAIRNLVMLGWMRLQFSESLPDAV